MVHASLHPGCDQGRTGESRGETDRGDFTLKAALEGLRFVFRAPLIRSTMLLDFLATFFSSATALLPIFAQDVLQVGPRGYGWLYAAPSIGAVVSSLIMVRLAGRIRQRRKPVECDATSGGGEARQALG